MHDDKAAISVAKTLDCKGDLCPMPIYKASKSISKLQEGEVLEVICTDRGSVKDFPAFCKQTGHDLVRAEVSDSEQTFYIRKKGKSE